MKKETLEETALRLYPNREYFLDRFQDIEREAFIKGYKLAQERSYSEEEDIGKRKISNPVVLALWFEQF